ncbi:Cytochrome P450 [Macleaya cordata]|uniref:Cytochrome P450 n=1 Tax=Macleaya cordata TaxID=56857 RepID=A0A200QH02_MACCD|nr:Cytochrome P450 [Macleaya cordata]
MGPVGLEDPYSAIARAIERYRWILTEAFILSSRLGFRFSALILAASDTTSVSLTWALTLLVTNPRVLRKAQDELDIKVGRDRHVEERDLNNLVYLQAIVKETLRTYPAVPLTVPHEATQDCTVGGYHVTAGTRVVVNLWKLQRDPRVWPNPSKFKPERFLSDGCDEGGGGGGGGEAANRDFRGQHFEYIPFGSGRRMCPGANFALQTLHMTLARLLHAFELRLPSSKDHDDDDDVEHPDEVVDMTEGSGLTMPKVTPLEVLLHPRLPLPLYEL